MTAPLHRSIDQMRTRVSDAEALAQWERALLNEALAEEAKAAERARFAKVLAPPKAGPAQSKPKAPKSDFDHASFLEDITRKACILGIAVCTAAVIALAYAYLTFDPLRLLGA